MKIKLTIFTDKNGLTDHIVSGAIKHCIYPLSERPEDAIIGRDLIDGNDLIHAAKLGYVAGIRAEKFEVEIVEVKQ